MPSAISLQARILHLNRNYQTNSNLDDNFDIRLSQKLSEFDYLDLPIIEKTVKGIKTYFFKVNRVNRVEYAQYLFNDLKSCELLGKQPTKERGKIKR